MNANCYIQMNPIPENYTGDLTIGTITEPSEPITLKFHKPGGWMYMDTTSDGAGLVTVTIAASQNAFFSHRYDSISVTAVKNPSQELVKFLDGTTEKDGVLLSFTPADCDWEDQNITLTAIDTSCEC